MKCEKYGKLHFSALLLYCGSETGTNNLRIERKKVENDNLNQGHSHARPYYQKCRRSHFLIILKKSHLKADDAMRSFFSVEDQVLCMNMNTVI